MPYVNHSLRSYVESGLQSAITFFGKHATEGEFAYFLARVLDLRARDGKGTLSYRAIRECLGDLEAAKLEFYRRVAAPYEDLKLQQNGDVYDIEA